jgi:uncharacterized protein (TIGR02246 family)
MIEQEVRERTLHLELAWNQGDHEAVAQLFGEDAWMAVEGVAHALRGQRAIHAWVRESMDAHPTIAIELVDLLNTGTASASTWIEWRLPLDDDTEGRATSLLLWIRTTDGVRIRAHSFSLTHF